VADRYGLGESLIYAWRRQVRGRKSSLTPPPSFVPVVVSDQEPSGVGGVIELVVGTVTVRVNGAVEAATLRQVLDVIRGLP